ncbi:fatty acyl-AMP ligase [Streptomyces sp. A7024]|uniref:Fatty acyl-AMP ligase n=1 Tax=Streptomyces coryli TaxID=1128680 RepID=A0A6G4UCS2_9ACTN|nr:fatty acyl-AMP ligase [Streptomyces coryli]
MRDSHPRPAPAYRPLTESLAQWSDERGHLRAFTFVEFPDATSPGLYRTLSWQRLYRKAQAVADVLAETARPGDRAALLLPQGLDYVAAFLGCLYARVIAVPLFTPDLPGHAGRLAAVLDDCEPACLITDAATEGQVRDFVTGHRGAAAPLVIVDKVRDNARPLAPAGTPDADDIAYLQYTSGSTRIPAGVMISHGNVVANAHQAMAAFDGHPDRNTTVGWLPFFHDMGLVLSIATPLAGAVPSVFMDPVAFLEQPLRWLWLLGAYRGTVSAAPNFAFDYCATRIDPEQTEGLRLDRVTGLINGSEPVRTATIERFADAFADAGLRPEAHCPSYGLAEATVLVSSHTYREEPRSVAVDRAALGDGRLVIAPDGGDEAAELVACGEPVLQDVCIADPETGAALPDGAVGEIRVRGANIGHGYWKRTTQSAETFAGRIPGDAGEPWLRTGDLGALHDGQLLVTGRLKDLIIVDGRNHYPHDIEETVQSAVPVVRPDRLAAFAEPETGRLVVVAEHRRGAEPTPGERSDAERLARTRISAEHGIRLYRLHLVEPGAVPRTSSGKISRSACLTRYLEGGYAVPAADPVAVEGSGR